MATEVQTTDQVGIFPNQIVRNTETITLRDVEEESVDFKNLVESIKAPLIDELGRQTAEHGLLNPISVRPYPGHPGEYCIVDGLHRWFAWRSAFGDSKPIPAYVKNLTDDQVIIAQMEANIHRKETTPIELSNQLLRYLDHHGRMPLSEIAGKLHMEVGWLTQILTLVKLPKLIQEKLNSGEIPTTVGIYLARFSKSTPKEPEKRQILETAQNQWMERYLQLQNTPQGFQQWTGEVVQALKSVRASLKTGSKMSASPGEAIAPVFTFRKKSDVEVELKRQDTDVLSSFSEEDRTTAEEFAKEYSGAAEFISALGYKKALQWVGQVDPVTIEERQKAIAQKEAEKASKKEAGKVEEKRETVARSRSLYEMFKK